MQFGIGDDLLGIVFGGHAAVFWKTPGRQVQVAEELPHGSTLRTVGCVGLDLQHELCHLVSGDHRRLHQQSRLDRRDDSRQLAGKLPKQHPVRVLGVLRPGLSPDLVPDELNQRLVILSQLVAPALQDLAAAIARADEVAAAADDGATAALSHLCGADWTPLSKAASALGEQLCDLAQAMADVRLLLRCENWYPPYRATVHDAVCQDGTAGLGWAVSTQLAIVLLSMIILTLRVAYYELDEVSGGNGSGCCGCFGGGANGKQDDTENEEESR